MADDPVLRAALTRLENAAISIDNLARMALKIHGESHYLPGDLKSLAELIGRDVDVLVAALTGRPEAELITECCHVPIEAAWRFCQKCGHEARVMRADSPRPEAEATAKLRWAVGFYDNWYQGKCPSDVDASTVAFELVTAIREHLAASPSGAGTWQPIETAPKDGTLFLVYAPGRDGLPEMQSLCAWHPDAGFCIDELRMATHWQPLPPAPTTE